MERKVMKTINPNYELSFDVLKDSDGVVLNPEVQSRTDQSFSKEADINFIVARAVKTGFLIDPLVLANASRKPLFSDFSELPDFLEVSNRLAAFKADFDLLPAELRAKFDNDPSKVIDYLADPANDAEAIELGLKPKPAPAPGPAPAPVPNPVPPVPVPSPVSPVA